MRNDIAIKTENISKVYRLFAAKSDRIREALHPFRRTYHRQFWALRNISLEIPQGRTVGIVGMNGSGKSTLLQIISSVLQPSAGIIRVNGKVAALLELGAGFNPHLTGRENVILNGTILGLSRAQILERMEEIQAFADIGEFFDQPMNTCSSGMFMRVAFSTAIHVDPEVLIIDEVLSVGDAKFQEKCFRRFQAFQAAGKTILFVTHDRSALPRHCDMGLLLHQGELVKIGDPGHVADLYGELLAFGRLREALPTSERAGRAPHPDDAIDHRVEQWSNAVRPFIEAHSTEDRCWRNPTYNKYEHRFGNGHAAIIDYMIVDQGSVNPTTICSGNWIDIYFKVGFRQDVEAPIVGMIFKNKEGVIAYGVNTDWMKTPLRPAKAGEVQAYRFRVQVNLCAGDWFVDLAVAESSTVLCDNRGALAHLYLMETRTYWGLARLDAQFSKVERATEELTPLDTGRTQ